MASVLGEEGMNEKFWAFVVDEVAEGEFRREIRERRTEDLPPGEVLMKVNYSSLNYKDALSASGHKGVTRTFPHTPGIDAAGRVLKSEVPEFSEGDAVLVTGYDLGMDTSGGFGQRIRVPSDWVVPLPASLSEREAMIYGTAGFTAALCVNALQNHDVLPQGSKVLVTGASGGVGSLACGILAHLGYEVMALTGKPSAHEWLKNLGVSEVLSREEFLTLKGRPLMKARWDGVVDTVGGEVLSKAVASTTLWGCVTACGMVSSLEVQTSIMPFILRGISLVGIASAETPMRLRLQLWAKLSQAWKFPMVKDWVREVHLHQLEAEIQSILKGNQSGRVLVDLSNIPLGKV